MTRSITSADDTSSNDIVKELRLRRWARENYVPVEDRDLTWHAIVLDEMANRDAERTQPDLTPAASAGYVPLAPTELYQLHEPQDVVREPNFLQIRQKSSVSTEWF